jgi:hypothetical protein
VRAIIVLKMFSLNDIVRESLIANQEVFLMADGRQGVKALAER